MIKKIIKYLRLILYQYQYIQFNKKIFINNNSNLKKNKILVEFYHYDPSIISFAVFANILSKKFDANIYGYTIGKKTYLKKIFYNFYHFSYWKIYQSFGVKKIFHLNNKYYDKKYFNFISKKLKTSKNILNLKIKNIPIGDLVYDEYLRVNNVAFIDTKDPKFLIFLKDVITAFFFWDAKLDGSVKSLIISHSVYLIGLPARIAIYKNIPVYNIAVNSVYFLSKKNITKFTGFDSYPLIFQKMKNNFHKNILHKTSKIILNKFLGKLDLAQITTPLISGSSIKSNDISKVFDKKLSKKKLILDENKTNILIASHCFTDAVHAHGKFIFLNFYEWFEFLINYSLKKKNYIWYVKMHPADFDRNKEILDSLLSKYENFVILPKDINHNEIISAKIDVVLSVNGSVGYEYPFVNIPVINASSNGPHQAYKFNYHAKSKKDYINLLDIIPKIKNKILSKHTKLKISEYYFVKFMTQYHFLNNLNNIMIKLKKNYNSPMIYNEYIKQFKQNEFLIQNEEIKKFILSKKNRIYADNTKKRSKAVLFY